jgi:hypothetical protein
MLLDNSDNGVTIGQWNKIYRYLTGLLTQLCKYAVRWQKEYKSLTEKQREDVKAKKEKEAKQEPEDMSLGQFLGFSV